MTRYKKWLIGSLVISAVSIALVTCLTFSSETIEALRKIRLEYILAAALLHILSYPVWGLRTRALCKALGHRISVLKVTEIVISSVFVAGITPSSAGGEFLRVHSLSRNRIPVGRATAIVVGERLLDALFIFSCLPFAFYVLGDILSDYKFDAAFFTANFLVFLLLVFFIYGVWKPEKVKYITRRLTGRLAPFFGKKTDAAISHFMEQIDREIDHFHDSVRVFFSEGRKGLLWGILYTFIFWTIEFSLLILILMGLSQTHSIITAFAAQVLLAVIMVIPATPGASGVAELGAASIFSIFVDSSVLGITVLAWRALTYHMNLLVGGLMSLKIIKDANLIKKLIGDSVESQHST
ncbi:integral membrane protein [Methanosarcina horonobensis HB-1 = JCM 15518]|uniref:Integral membrane protein n=2 Tax=Methanosarcina horonobensis TaxID=418008 RepID=A0A0E3SCC4_9EURY|nr:flippase-like domain-containing protein [Methanosarcina horonobensis]AKB77587.1 integral membrane protein [Methanosarcina horonobensis HB-1 = JCM 15518]